MFRANYIIIIIACFAFFQKATAQVEVDREGFNNTTNLASPQGFCGGDTGGCSTSSNIFNIATCTSFTGSGGTQSFFWAQDFDACGSTTNPHVLTVDLQVPPGDNGEITFEGMFAQWCCFSGMDANDSVRIEISTNGGGSYSNELLVSKSGGDQLRITDGVTSNNLTTTFTKRSLSLGTGLGGATVRVRLTYYNLVSGSEGLAIDEFVLLHTPPACTPPASSPTNIVFGTATGTSIDFGWTNTVAGTDVLVVVKEEASTLTDPTNGTPYTGSTVFGSGTQIGTGNYVIYAGVTAGSSPITLTGLNPATSYNFAIYSYNSADNCYNIVELSGSQSTLCTEPTTQASGISFPSVSGSSIDVSWTNGNGNATLVVVRPSSAFGVDPSHGVVYSANAVFASGDQTGTDNYVVYNGTGTSVSITGLNPGTSYDVSIYTYFNAGPCYLLTELSGTESTDAIVVMSSTTVTTCGGVFYDPGGTGNYPNGATITMTILPEVTGDAVCLDFTDWELDYNVLGFSTLSFYDGATVLDPLILTATGEWDISGASAPFDFKGPGMVCSTSGALTIVWNPDDTDVGWEANISCYTPVAPVASCNLTAQANVLEVCPGEAVDLDAIGNIVSVELNNDFNGGNIGAGWSSSVTGDFINPCDAAGADGTTYFWMGTNPAPRTLSTPTYDVSNGGMISFDHKQAIQGGSNPCEGPDLPDEGVYLQYSIDAGATWVTIHYFVPYFYTDGSEHLRNWQRYHFDIPPAARTASTAFRFTQQEISSNSTDHWGLDNVAISKNNTSTISWDNGLGVGAEHTVNPAVETTYTATISDGSSSCSSNVTITMCLTLPVEFVSFQATCHKKNTLVSWETASEVNNDYFIVEKSTDGVNFIEVGRVAGSGNSTQLVSYSYMDDSGSNGSNYYRLVQVDFNGDATTTETIVGESCGEQWGSIQGTHYNSQTGELIVAYSATQNELVQIDVHDVTGRLVKSKSIQLLNNNAQVAFPIQLKNSTSIYLVSVTTNTTKFHQKIYKRD